MPGISAALLLGVLLSLRPAAASAADPTLAADRMTYLRHLIEEDDQNLAAVVRELQAAVDAARRGSARIIDGEVLPAADLRAAAEHARTAVRLRGQGISADDALDSSALAILPQHPLPAGPGMAALVGIDGQLDSAASASGPFVERRLAAQETLAALADALADLKASRAGSALMELDRADAARATVAAWPNPPAVLPFWLDTTASMLDAARAIASATLRGDAAAATRAGQRYEDAAQDAGRADAALAIAISESGASLASVPLGRLADALEALSERRAAMASVLHS